MLIGLVQSCFTRYCRPCQMRKQTARLHVMESSLSEYTNKTVSSTAFLVVTFLNCSGKFYKSLICQKVYSSLQPMNSLLFFLQSALCILLISFKSAQEGHYFINNFLCSQLWQVFIQDLNRWNIYKKCTNMRDDSLRVFVRCLQVQYQSTS